MCMRPVGHSTDSSTPGISGMPDLVGRSPGFGNPLQGVVVHEGDGVEAPLGGEVDDLARESDPSENLLWVWRSTAI